MRTARVATSAPFLRLCSDGSNRALLANYISVDIMREQWAGAYEGRCFPWGQPEGHSRVSRRCSQNGRPPDRAGAAGRRTDRLEALSKYRAERARNSDQGK